MAELSAEERDTLEQLLQRDAQRAFDGATLSDLHAKGFVSFSIDGWEVTPLGVMSMDTTVYV